METFPLPAIAAASAALVALPFSAAAAGTLLLTAALGTIIHADYAGRQRRVSLPRRILRRSHTTPPPFRKESNRLAA